MKRVSTYISLILCLFCFELSAQKTVTWTNLHNFRINSFGGLRYDSALAWANSAAGWRYATAVSEDVLNQGDSGSFSFVIDSVTKKHSLYGLAVSNFLEPGVGGFVYAYGDTGAFPGLTIYADIHHDSAFIYSLGNKIDSFTVTDGDTITFQISVVNASLSFLKDHNAHTIEGSTWFCDTCVVNFGWSFNIGVAVEADGGGIDPVQCTFNSSRYSLGNYNYSVTWDTTTFLGAQTDRSYTSYIGNLPLYDTSFYQSNPYGLTGSGWGISGNKLQNSSNGYVTDQWFTVGDARTFFGLIQFKDWNTYGNGNYFIIGSGTLEDTTPLFIIDDGSYAGYFGMVELGDVLEIIRYNGYFGWVKNGDMIHVSAFSMFDDALPPGITDTGMNAIFALQYGDIFFNLNSSFPVPVTPSATGANQQWAATTGHSDSLSIVRITHDSQQNAILAGCTINNTTGPDVLTAKYSPSGSLLWQQTWSGSGYHRDEATAVAVDDSDNIYVTGATGTGIVSDSNFAYVTIKYNSSGVQQWVQTYIGTLDTTSIPTAIAVNQNFVYVTGGAANTTTLLDYTTIQYNRHTGVQNWVANYDNAHLIDGALAMSPDTTNGGVVVTGISQDSYTDDNYATVYYDASGTQLNVITASGTTDGSDHALSVLKSDAGGNTLVTGAVYDGATGYDIKTIKYNSAGTLLWTAVFDYHGLTDIGTDLLEDSVGNVYVCGYGRSSTTGYDYLLIKYNASGTQLWQQSFDGAGLNDSAAKMTFNTYGDIVVTGQSQTADSNYNFLTLAYHPDSTLFWQQYYNGGGCGGNSEAMDITADNAGNVYVAGTSYDCTSQVTKDVAVKYGFAYLIAPPDTDTFHSSMLFYPNYGQIVDTAHSVRPDVYYYTINQSPKIYIDTVGVIFVFAKCDSDTTIHKLIIDTLERIDMQFMQQVSDYYVNGNITKPYESAIHDNPYLNYFLSQCPDGIVNVKGCEKLTQKSVYSNIDVEYANNNAGMKFYIIVNPGGNMSGKVLHFTGQQSVSIDGSGELHVEGVLGSIDYDKPEVYQVDESNQRIDLPWSCSYINSGSYIWFAMESYNNSLPLIIECRKQNFATAQGSSGNLEYSTYYGGSVEEEARNVRTDKRYHPGETYVVGLASSPKLPTFPGITPIQPTLGGASYNAFVYKMYDDPMTTDHYLACQWWTYYGGINGDFAEDVAINSSKGYVYFVGDCNSVNTFPAQPSSACSTHCYNFTSACATEDAFIVKLTNDGQTKLWSTRFGGCSNEEARGVAIDGNNNVYVVGWTNSDSSSQFPLQSFAGGYNQTAIGGATDGFIARFDQYDNLQWCSYFGGNSFDGFSDIKIDGNNHVYLVGWTDSNNPSSTSWNGSSCPNIPGNGFQLCDDGASAWQQTAFGGNEDAFIVEFDDQCRLKWSSYFGGTGLEDARGWRLDLIPDAIGDNKLFVAGAVAYGWTNFPQPSVTITNPECYLQNFVGTTSDVNFAIAEFDNRDLVWSTFFGYDDGEGSGGCGLAHSDDGGILYVSGTVNNSTGAVATALPSPCNGPPSTTSDPFPLCQNFSSSYMQVYGGGNSDGFIAAFDILTGTFTDVYGHLEWCTFLGGSDDDETSGLSTSGALDPWASVYITGSSTGSTTPEFPYLIPNYVNATDPVVQQPKNAGYENAVIMRFSEPSAVTGIKDVSIVSIAGTTLDLFPNPGAGIYQIKWNNKELTPLEIEVYDVLGRVVKIYDLNKQRGQFELTIDLSNEANGMYAVSVITNNGIYIAKAIKLN